MQRSFLRIPKAVLLLGACSFASCGPNVQMIYEGNVRFEHCYRLDLDQTIAPPHRRACWQDWLARHTYGQTGDRLTHARQRLVELDGGDQSTLPLQVDAGAQRLQTGAAVPMPTSIHNAPPAKAVEPEAVASATAPRVNPPVPSPPENDCSNACREQWNDCAPACNELPTSNIGSESATPTLPAAASPVTNQKNEKMECIACARAFKACMRRCFR